MEGLVNDLYHRLKPLTFADFYGKYNLDGYLTYGKFE